MEDTIVVHNTAAVVQQSENFRAMQVMQTLTALQNTSEDTFFDTCDLLHEAHEKSYHLDFGFATFKDWIEFSKLDMSSRQAAYMVNIADKALSLNVDRPTLKRIKITKLKEIFSLSPDEHSSEMHALLEVAEAMSLNEVKARVRALKSGTGVEEMIFMTVKFPVSAKAVIDSAFDKARANHGGGGEDGITNGTALEMICADYNAGQDPDPTNVEIQINVPEDFYEVEDPLGLLEEKEAA